MDIYILSRGRKQDQDYRWLRINSDRYYPENPSFLTQFVDNSGLKPVDLIESQKQSIILVAKANNYYLLVTGLKASEDRTDFTGRSIRNSVLWICQNSDGEKVRSLLIRALKGTLEAEIDKTIYFGGEYGFEVDRESLLKLSSSVLGIENNRHSDLNCQIGSNCESLRQQTALELQTSPLPHRNGLLVLVTSIKSASVLKQAAVWRGLSNRIKGEEFEVYSSLKTVHRIKKKTIFLGIAIATILLIAIALSRSKFTTFQKPQPDETTPIPSIIQEDSCSTSTEKLNPVLDLIQTNKRDSPTSSNTSKEDCGI